MTKMTDRGILLLAVAIGCAGYDGRSSSGPTALPPAAPSAPTVTAISPSSTARRSPPSFPQVGQIEAGLGAERNDAGDRCVFLNALSDPPHMATFRHRAFGDLAR
jgi:hypothetical protein